MLESNKTPQLSLTPEVADPQLEQAVASIQQQSVQAAPRPGKGAPPGRQPAHPRRAPGH